MVEIRMGQKGRTTVVLTIWVLTSALLLSAGSRTTSAADNHTFYFPWVPNGETIGGQGPWYADVSFQNLGSNSCAIGVYVPRGGNWPASPTAQLSLTGGSSRSVSSESLGVSEPGSPM